MFDEVRSTGSGLAEVSKDTSRPCLVIPSIPHKDVASQQSRSFFDVALREFLLLAKRTQPVPDFPVASNSRELPGKLRGTLPRAQNPTREKKDAPRFFQEILLPHRSRLPVALIA